MTNCPICQSPIKTVPAGISKKTGNPYEAFQACSKFGCPWKPEREKKPFVPGPGKVAQISQMQDNKAKHIAEAQDRKVDSIRMTSACRDATLMVTNFYPELAVKPNKEELLKIEWRKWKAWFYNRSAEVPAPDQQPFGNTYPEEPYLGENY